MLVICNSVLYCCCSRFYQ